MALDHRTVNVGAIVLGGCVGAALGAVSGNVPLVSTTFAAIAGGIGRNWDRQRREPATEC